MINLCNKSAIFDIVEIGEAIEWGDKILIAREGNTCAGCYFNISMQTCRHIHCSGMERPDQKDIIFSEYNDRVNVEKRVCKKRRLIMNHIDIINLIKKKYDDTKNPLYKELLDEIGGYD